MNGAVKPRASHDDPAPLRLTMVDNATRTANPATPMAIAQGYLSPSAHIHTSGESPSTHTAIVAFAPRRFSSRSATQARHDSNGTHHD